jgi:hypothetical protein
MAIALDHIRLSDSHAGLYSVGDPSRPRSRRHSSSPNSVEMPKARQDSPNQRQLAGIASTHIVTRVTDRDDEERYLPAPAAIRLAGP